MNEKNTSTTIPASDENPIAKMATDPSDAAFETLVRGMGLNWRDLAKMGKEEIDGLIVQAGIDDPTFNKKIYTYSAVELSLLRD